MINLKFVKDQYNAFIYDDKMKVMSQRDDLDPVVRLKSEDGAMMPWKKASSMRTKEGAM